MSEARTVFFNFCDAHLPVKREITTKFTYFLFWTRMSEIRNRGKNGEASNGDRETLYGD